MARFERSPRRPSIIKRGGGVNVVPGTLGPKGPIGATGPEGPPGADGSYTALQTELADTNSPSYQVIADTAATIADPAIASALDDDDSAATLALLERQPWIDPHIEYGAVGDGITDDAAAIQAALNAASSGALRKTVRLRRGHTYRLGTHVTISGDMHLDGGGATFKPLAASTMRAIAVTSSEATLTDLLIDMNRAETADGGSSNNQQGVYVAATNVTLTDVTVRRVHVINSHQRGIVVQAAGTGTISDILIEDCLVADVGDRGIHVGGTDAATNAGVHVRNCRVNRSAMVGIVAQGVSDAHVTNCRVALDATAGDHGIGLSATGAPSTDCSVTGCVVSGVPLGWGIISTWGGTRFFISNNTVIDCFGGIAVDPERGSEVGVEVDVSATITGNVVNGSFGIHGISARLCSGLSITGNTVQDTYDSGIAVASATGVSVTGNNLARLGQHGIGIFGITAGGGHTVGGNVIRDWGQRAGGSRVHDSGTPIPNAYLVSQSTP